MGLIGKKRHHQKRGRPRGALHIRMQRNRPLSPSFSWRYSPAGRPGGSISKANSQAAGASRRNERTDSRINPSILSLSPCRPAAVGATDDKATPIESDPSSRLVSSHLCAGNTAMAVSSSPRSPSMATAFDAFHSFITTGSFPL